ncbi:MAG: Bifunctional protein FolD protein [Alphaproteobacteria bacterium ADurb.Bin438]|nr:MAG: Bifunctional protein FolD protein [Alphaproteobacteria bacterium ADurb.Bin438]
MTATIINGKEIANSWCEKIKEYIAKTNYKPYMAVIVVGDNPASAVYVKNKRINCEKLGIKFKLYHFKENISEYSLLTLIEELNVNTEISGILVQMPLPNHIDSKTVIEKINPLKDVDGFHPFNIGTMVSGNPSLISCTPMGIVKMIEEVVGHDLSGKRAVVVGRSIIVGKPISAMLLNMNATVTTAHSKTSNLQQVCREADILICAIGKKEFFTKEYVKEGAIVIDVGISRGEDGKLKGDVAFDEVKDIASHITPVPGGVGPMTIAMLMYNVVKTYCLLNGKKFEL